MLKRDSSYIKKGSKNSIDIILGYINLLLKHKWLIIIITVIAAAGAVTFAYISIKLPPDKSPLPNFYRADTLVMIEDEGARGVDSLFYSLGMNPQGQRLDDESSNLAFRILNTRTFIDKVIEEFDIPAKYKLPAQDKRKLRTAILTRTHYTYDLTTRSLVFSYEDIDPQFAMDILNWMIEQLINWFSTEGSATKLNRKGLLEKKLAEVEFEIADLEEKIQTFQREHKVLSVEEIATIQTDILSNLRSQLILKEMEIKNYSEFSKIEDSVITRLKAERNNILETIRQVEQGYFSEGNIMPSRDELPKLFQEFDKLNTDLQIQRRIYETLSQQYEVAKLTLETTPVYRVLEWAELPQEKAGPARGKICVMITFGAFMFSCMLILAINFLKTFKFVPNKTNDI